MGSVSFLRPQLLRQSTLGEFKLKLIGTEGSFV